MKYKRPHKVPWRVVEGKAVLVSVKNSQVLVFNEVGTSIWEFLDKERTVDDIVGHLLSEFDTDRSVAEKDAKGFLDSLQEKEIIDVK
ncbi:MAG: PqqD family protein [Candidatus Omnitrophota bacterium]